MANADDCRYSDSHEWFHLDGDVVTVGLSPYAVNEMTDITYVEMNEAGTDVSPGDAIGEVESVKTTSEIFSVVPGEIVEVNEALVADPAMLNRDPYDEGWLVRIRTTDASQLDSLMDHATYEQKHPVA